MLFNYNLSKPLKPVNTNTCVVAQVSWLWWWEESRATRRRLRKKRRLKNIQNLSTLTAQHLLEVNTHLYCSSVFPLCFFILLQHFRGNIVPFTALHLSDSCNYFSDSAFTWTYVIRNVDLQRLNCFSGFYKHKLPACFSWGLGLKPVSSLGLYVSDVSESFTMPQKTLSDCLNPKDHRKHQRLFKTSFFVLWPFGRTLNYLRQIN